MDVMDFFRLSAGKWRSQRTTHHLAFRRTEIGDLEIYAETLDLSHPKLIEICEMHSVDPGQAIGGAYVKWNGWMEWDRDEEDHTGETVFVLVPDADRPNQGQLLRERGYAEIVPVIGQYLVDETGGLILITEYETMSSVERFWFPSPDLRLRTSTVKRYGGFNTASFCAETRISTPADRADEAGDLAVSSSSSSPDQNVANAQSFHSVWGW